jgi:hypothetical protein
MEYQLLPSLPREILQDILSLYCDKRALATFWQAVSGSRFHGDAFWFLLGKAVVDRFGNINEVKDDLLSCIPRVPEEQACRSIQTRHLSQSLTVLEYSERISDVIWCGHMEFKDPMLPDWSAQHVRVVLRSDESWSLRNLHGWNLAFPATIKLVSTSYNFIPVRPRGRIYGLTREDSATIRDIRRRLEARDQVMTLRFGNDDGFILRIISPEQAQQRLSSFFRGGSKGSFEIFPDGLLCCWEFPSDVPLTIEDHLKSISLTVGNYRHLVSD